MIVSREAVDDPNRYCVFCHSIHEIWDLSADGKNSRLAFRFDVCVTCLAKLKRLIS